MVVTYYIKSFPYGGRQTQRYFNVSTPSSRRGNEKRKSYWISIFLLLINVIVIKFVTETLIALLYVEGSDVRVSMTYFDQILGKGESQTRQVFNFADI